jgi:hypothetical protein
LPSLGAVSLIGDGAPSTARRPREARSPGDAEVGREGDDGLVDPPQHPGGGEQVRPVRVRIAGDLGRCGVDDALAGTDVVP